MGNRPVTKSHGRIYCMQRSGENWQPHPDAIVALGWDPEDEAQAETFLRGAREVSDHDLVLVREVISYEVLDA